ncbi:thyroid receptor-interacting protein 11 [Uranotaenia lowii]|uniref:thyroid receptor-interacting protein 11 n=1 Tax=Uranotaenia lowii TaxID=190385 RepID=UPI00247911E2|nr:thyroid receptor-interacting protein 11 [Uranotaenia lowii]
MDSQIPCSSSAQDNVFDFIENLINSIPEHTDASAFGTTTQGATSKPMGTRRILKMRQQLNKQNNFIADLKKKIRVLGAASPKSISDQEELAFLKSRLAKENDLLNSLMRTLIEEQKKEQSWEPIRLCTDPMDDVVRSPWMLGGVAMQDPRFSFDSTLSSLSSQGHGDIDDTMKYDDVTKQFQKELMNRDRVIEILQNRLDGLTADVMKVKRDNNAILDKTPKNTKFCEADMLNRLRFYKENTDALEQNLHQMGAALNVIRSELGTNIAGTSPDFIDCSGLHRTSNFSGNHECSTPKKSCPKNNDDQYNELMKEFANKSEECKKLTDRLAKSCSCKADSPEQVELDLLKKRCSELLDEHDEFKILIKEQGEQLDEYRKKFLDAQQTVEEQKLKMNKMDITNNRIEEQINIEVQRIKAKFQDKLRKLLPFPGLLEAEETKVKNLKDSNEKLLAELKKSAKEIRCLESKLHNAHVSQNSELEQAYRLMKTEMEQTTDMLEEEKKAKQKLQEQVSSMQQEMEEVRSEAAKIICRTNNRIQEDKNAAQERLRVVELELAQCRAAAAVTIQNREEALREMHRQIGVLSASFEDAQMQIKSLRNQLTYLQNERISRA